MEVTGMDTHTAMLAIELQLADTNGILDELGVAGDAYVAFGAMKTAFEDILQLLQSRALVVNAQRADFADRILIERFVQEERQAAEDHTYACRLAGIDPGNAGNQYPGVSSSSAPLLSSWEKEGPEEIISAPLDDPIPPVIWERRVEGLLEAVNDSRSSVSGPSTRASYKGKGKSKATESDIADEHTTHIICAACMDRYARFDALELACKRKEDVTYHAYCRGCLIDLFKTSLSDTTLFPPRCCGTRISLSACLPLIPPELVKQYEEKETEMAATNPTYCSNRSCAQFIRPENITADVAACPKCRETTCTTCKNPSHRGICPADPTSQMLLDFAGKQRWQRCYKCRTLVELVVGCYHMQ